jgi:hypothetical protein
MDTIETPVRKPGRPTTRLLTRARSNSLGSQATTPEAPLIVAIPPVFDLVVVEQPDRVEQPRVENATTPLGPATDAAQTDPPVQIPEPSTVDPKMKVNHLLRKQAQKIVYRCQELLEIYEGVQLNQHLLNNLVSMSKELLEEITACDDQLDDVDELADVSRELKRWQRIIKTFMISKLGNYETPSATPAPQPVFHPQPAPREKRDASPDTLELTRRDLTFFMSKLHDDVMPDIAVGADVSNSELRDLHDFLLPQIAKAVDDCRKVLKIYTSNGSYSRGLARDAQEKCENASIWTSDLLARYHRQKLHLDKNIRHREITFSIFKPGGEVSIYQFLNRFETWADGYLSEEAKADQLYNKYLDKSITESYTEISLLQEDFEEMKLWLIKKYGSVVPIAHGCIKAILKIAVPNESNHSASVQYLRSVHRLLVNLSELEISKGRPVPKLQSYLGSNAFLSALIEALPLYIKNQLFKELLNEGIDDIDTVEGKHHVASIVRIIKLNFMRLELIVKSSPSIVSQPQQVKPQNNNQQPKKMSKPDSNIHHQSSNVPNNQQLAVQAPNPQRSSGQNTSFPPVLTGGNATPLGNSNQYQPNNQQRQNNQQNQANVDRWACPIKNHSGHNIIECVDFWNLSPQDRRSECKFASCFTCLDRSSRCRGSCKRIQEVPAEVICTDCANGVRNGYSPVCILMCGLRHHTKTNHRRTATCCRGVDPQPQSTKPGSHTPGQHHHPRHPQSFSHGTAPSKQDKLSRYTPQQGGL